ncbi:MAG: cytochrome c biogenesis protein ResB [Candidatus Obscuribacterales bacterium]|nr:cytochrome c biogenesis protein ResB [Candidatus Obscuribacterales bacterium]
MLNLRLSSLASVKLTIAIFAAILVTILLGAWCPQESQGGFEKVVETFGPGMALQLHDLGITDMFHSPVFLGLIGLLTVNMLACSFQRVFPKIRLYRQPIAFMSNKEIVKFPVTKTIQLKVSAEEVLQAVQARFKKQGYTIRTNGAKVTGEWGKFGRMAASVTHVGLLSLLVGVTITSWTGFTGFKPVSLGKSLSFADSEHSKQWLGKLPDWTVHVDATRREDYESGDAKQWYSTLSVISPKGVVLKKQEISVNNPLEYEGVDIYQSSWGLDSIAVAFNGQRPQKLQLQQMGATQAAFLPLDDKTILIFSLRKQDAPLRVFGKIPEWQQPKMLAEIPPGKTATFGTVPITYLGPVPVTGLQYKSDPGLPVTYVAFGIIILGVMLAAVPHRQLWIYVGEGADGTATLYMGGVSKKAKRAFEKSIDAAAAAMVAKYGEAPVVEAPESSSPPEEVEVLSYSNVSSP